MISLEDLIRINKDGIGHLAARPYFCDKITTGAGKSILVNPNLGWYIIRHGHARKQEIYFCRGFKAAAQIRMEADEIQVIGNLPLFSIWEKTKNKWRLGVVCMMSGEMLFESEHKGFGEVYIGKVSNGAGFVFNSVGGDVVGGFDAKSRRMPEAIIDDADMPAVRKDASREKISYTILPNCITQSDDGLYKVAYFRNAGEQARKIQEVIKFDTAARNMKTRQEEVIRTVQMGIDFIPEKIYGLLAAQVRLCKTAEYIGAINESVSAARHLAALEEKIRADAALNEGKQQAMLYELEKLTEYVRRAECKVRTMK
ncbi:MAG: hypothetical protein FWE17_01150 [Alphaproteobacteria bacterium]|nr:hypothetical protein [Alphaproteobacteria bacterium]MCL2758305.1 hypothetical protein [Alphaproteobacteria bacterium]